MAKKARKELGARAPVLPPPTVAQCWLTFVKWVLGVPLLVAAALTIIAGGIWALGGTETMSNQGYSDMVSTLWWLLVIVLLYPAMIWIWVGDLREGLRAARDWAALDDEGRAAALAARPPEPAPKRRKR